MNPTNENKSTFNPVALVGQHNKTAARSGFLFFPDVKFQKDYSLSSPLFPTPTPWEMVLSVLGIGLKTGFFPPSMGSPSFFQHPLYVCFQVHWSNHRLKAQNGHAVFGNQELAEVPTDGIALVEACVYLLVNLVKHRSVPLL